LIHGCKPFTYVNQREIDRFYRVARGYFLFSAKDIGIEERIVEQIVNDNNRSARQFREHWRQFSDFHKTSDLFERAMELYTSALVKASKRCDGYPRCAIVAELDGTPGREGFKEMIDIRCRDFGYGKLLSNLNSQES